MIKRIMYGVVLLALISLFNTSNGYAFELNGFADVSFTKSTEGADEFRNGDFAFGTLDLYFAQTMEDIEVLVELIVEMGDVLDLERLTLGYRFNDAIRVKVGRFHTPLGFWNTAYHHGVQLQPTILRPEFLNFEDDAGILPTHSVGTYLSGRVRTMVGAVEYGGMVGNGPRITASEEEDANVLFPNNISDNNIGKAVAFHVALSPEMIQGLKIGVSGHMSRVQSSDTVDIDVDNADGDNDPTTGVEAGSGDVDVDQTILGAALTYSIGNLGLAGEYFSIEDENNAPGGESDTNDAYYGLITYTFKDRWVPYLMYEDMSADEDDPYFLSLGTQDVTKYTAGLRYNINYRSSVKGEFRSVEKEDNNWDEYAIQWALAF